MQKMSRISRFCGQPQEKEIDGEKFMMSPLKGKHLYLFMNENASPEEQSLMAQQIVFHSLKPSEPELTLEEVQEMELSKLNQFLMAAMEVNGMGEDERIRKIKAKLVSEKIETG